MKQICCGLVLALIFFAAQARAQSILIAYPGVAVAASSGNVANTTASAPGG
jgi:hypothetical protein